MAQEKWLANCREGFGFSMTEYDAMFRMAVNSSTIDEAIEVTLVRYHGEAEVWVGGYEVDGEVSYEETFTIEPEFFNTMVGSCHQAELDIDEALAEG